eukprot:6152809-Amphidinium_carterae.1
MALPFPCTRGCSSQINRIRSRRKARKPLKSHRPEKSASRHKRCRRQKDPQERYTPRRMPRGRAQPLLLSASSFFSRVDGDRRDEPRRKSPLPRKKDNNKKEGDGAAEVDRKDSEPEEKAGTRSAPAQ